MEIRVHISENNIGGLAQRRAARLDRTVSMWDDPSPSTSKGTSGSDTSVGSRYDRRSRSLVEVADSETLLIAALKTYSYEVVRL